jgi:hypothetical protein
MVSHSRPGCEPWWRCGVGVRPERLPGVGVRRRAGVLSHHDPMTQPRPVRPLGTSDCEAIRAGWLAQPVAAATSTGFVVGAGVLWRLWARSARGPSPIEPSQVVYATTLALTGIGSVLYHGPQGRAAAVVHDTTIAAMLVQAVAVPVVRRARRRPVLARHAQRPAVATGAALTAAIVAYGLGRTASPACRPGSLLQWHGVWHVLAAAGFTTWGATLWPTRMRLR